VRTGADYRAIREALGLSRQELGDALEVSEGAIKRRESAGRVRREAFLALSALKKRENAAENGSPVVFL